MKKELFVLLALVAAVSVSDGALIVTADPAAARFDSATDNDDAAGGFNAGNPDATQNAFGLTFNVTFTPAAGDLDSTTQAVNVLEVGGDANGSGLYLLGGELHFISKMNGGGANFIGAFNDLDFASSNNLIGVKSSFGPLAAGTEYSVAVLFDPIDAVPLLEIGVLPTGGLLSKETYSLSGVGTKTNWDGDNSATAFRGSNVANFGGSVISTNGNTAYPFHENNINANPFEGGQGRALYWTVDNVQIIPEPAGVVLVLFGAVGLLLSRRKR